MRRQASATYCSPTSPATRASCPAWSWSTGSTSVWASRRPTPCSALLDAVIGGLEPDFALVKLEGDAVFAAAPAAGLDGQGDHVLDKLRTTYRAFIDSRTAAIPSSDHICTACPAVAHLDLKVVIHRGHAVRQAVGSGSDLLGSAVTVAHRLLKNTIRERIGFRPYLFLTDAAATALGLSQVGLAHSEEYPDAGLIQGRIVELGEPVDEGVPT